MKLGIFSFGKDANKNELTKKRSLPVGVTEFHAWADNIIAGAQLTATAESQKFALANLLINLNPTIAFEADVYFIHALRKTAVNQVAEFIRQETRDAAKARLAAAEAAKQNQANATPPENNPDGKVVEIKRV